jgi:hypothetical protein
MTIMQKLFRSGPRTGRRWYKLGDGGAAVRQTDVWEHETFVEEQARWERSDPEYARLCDEVRQAKDRGEEASRRADEVKAEWDARVASQRQANDDAQRARTRCSAIHAREPRHHTHTTFAIESNDSPAPGIMPELVRVHDERAERAAPAGDRRGAAQPCVRGLATQYRVSDEPRKLEVV